MGPLNETKLWCYPLPSGVSYVGAELLHNGIHQTVYGPVAKVPALKLSNITFISKRRRRVSRKHAIIYIRKRIYLARVCVRFLLREPYATIGATAIHRWLWAQTLTVTYIKDCLRFMILSFPGSSCDTCMPSISRLQPLYKLPCIHQHDLPLSIPGSKVAQQPTLFLPSICC